MNIPDNKGLLRIGTVSSVSGNTARVKFDDVGIMSGDLKIVQFDPVMRWSPLPGATVLCLFDGTFNGNGYIIGTL